MHCTEKACPFPPNEGRMLCRHHQRTYAFESSDVFGSSVDMTHEDYDDIRGRTVDGLQIHNIARSIKPTHEEQVLGIYHRVLGGATLIKRIFSAFDTASPASVDDWCKNHFAAQELFEFARYDDLPLCPLCGGRDLWVHYSGIRKMWRCRECRFRFSITRSTLLSDSALRLDQWASCLRAIRSTTHPPEVIRVIQSNLNCTYVTAWKLNYKVRIAGLIGGLNLGFPGQRNNKVYAAVAEKAGVSLFQAR